MNWQRVAVPVVGAALVALAWQRYGGPGVAVVVGGMVMWVLLHFTRLMHVLKRAAERPIGFVGSAVMLNAKLRRGLTLMHVVAMTRALGEPLSPKDQQPEVYRWTDGSASHVTCTFAGGKLVAWTLERPPADDASDPAPAPRVAASAQSSGGAQGEG